MKNSKRKIGRLSLSAGITALVLVGILLLNILFSYIANNRLLYLDVSKEGFSELSAESTELLDKIDPDTTNITIYFLADRDELSSPILGYSSSSGRTTGQNEMWGMRYVHELALAIAAKYDYVSVDYLNMNNDKEMIDTFQTTVGYSFRKSSVVIDNCTYEYDKNGSPLLDENGVHLSHHNYRICSRDAFFTFDEDTGYVYAFNGDLRYTSVILSLSGLSPTVYFLTGHGEKVGDEEDENDFGKAQAMRDLLFEAGFTVKKANLVKDYKEVFSDSRARLLVAFGPTEDYLGYTGQVNEVSLLRKFSIGENHHMMFFFDKTDKPLTNLEEYIADYCGVTLSGALVKDRGSSDMSSDGYTFAATYDTNQYSVGLNLTSQLTELDSPPKVAFKNAQALNVSEEFEQSSGFYEDVSSKYTGAVFLAPESSVAVDGNDNVIKDYSSERADPLMVLCYDSWLNNNNEESATYTTICGTTDFASAEFLGDFAYGNRDVLFLTMRLMGREVVPFEIDFKVVQSEGLDMYEHEAVIWEICLSAIIPVVMLVLGTIVFIKRRHM